MKKVLSILLISIMCFSMCACGKSKDVKNAENLIDSIGVVGVEDVEMVVNAKKVYGALSGEEKEQVENAALLYEAEKEIQYLCAKEAYFNIKKAWQIVEQAGADVYVAWHGCVENPEKISQWGLEYFHKFATCPLDDATLTEAFGKTLYQLETTNGLSVSDESIDGLWDSLPETEKDIYRNAIADKSAFTKWEHTVLSLHGIWRAYDSEESPLKEAKEMLLNAKNAMKVLDEYYEDYQYYPNLKGFYTTTNSLMDLCALKTKHGSFNQYSDTLNDYRTEARNYMNDLDFVFE